MILLIDNYDSFTWNLWHFISDLGVEVATYRNDAITVQQALAMKPEAIVLSPGPCTPNEAGICIDLVSAAADANVPLLGVCLGFQAIGIAFGATLSRIEPPVHGKISLIRHHNTGVMENCPDPLAVVRYHSLILERETLPECLSITAESETGIVMAIEHRDAPIHGVLFHPESIATVAGYQILANFLGKGGVKQVDSQKVIALEEQLLRLHERFPNHIHT